MNIFERLSKRVLVKGGLALFLVNVSSSILSFLSGAVIALALGPYERGIYQAWRIFTSIFSDISNFGLAKFISSKFKIESTSFHGLLRHILLNYLLITALLPLMIQLHFSTQIIIICYLLVPVGIATDIYTGLLTRNELYSLIARWNFLVMVGGPILTILLYSVKRLTLESAVLSSSILASLAIVIGIKNVKLPRGNKSIYLNYKLILPIYLSNILRTFFLFLDQILVLYFLNLTELGIYAMGLAVAGVTTIITNPLYLLSPSIAKRKSLKKIVLVSQLFAAYLFMTLLSILFCQNFLATIIVHTIGINFLPIVEIVPILFAGKLLQSFVQFLISWSIYENESKVLIIEKVLQVLGFFISGVVFFSSKTIESAAWIPVISLMPSLIFFLMININQVISDNR